MSPEATVRRFPNAAWRGPELGDSARWVTVLTQAQRAAIAELGLSLESRGISEMEAHKPSSSEAGQWAILQDAMRDVRKELREERGFVLMRGFPVSELSPQATKLAYAALGSMLGAAMPQNKRGELIHDVRDAGASKVDPNVRLSITNAEQDFHTDAADLIGLLCLQKSKSGGVSRIVSSVTVYNEVAAVRTDLAALLFEPWYFHMKGEQAAGALPYFQLPIAHDIGGRLSSFFIAWYIRHAEQLEGVPPLTPAQQEALDLYEATANRADLYLDMHFEPGDIQWLKNSVILHKRSEYEDWPEPERKRHLLRLWLAAPDFQDGIVALRQGHKVAA